ncbi:MAG: pyridoxal phosphate-dependent aminotransferase [Lachnospiraceae bacterium]|nr:pyridoxal phosphate-dependent aminotransferase [Lachnospiraceae bacterium]
MAEFTNKEVNLEVLKQRAYNLRWAEVEEGVIPLTAADPDFPAPGAIAEDLIAYIRGGYFSYTPKRGFPEFAESLSRVLKERKHEDVDPKLILPVDSAARGMNIIAHAVLQPGDEALVFDPVDFLFKTNMEEAGAKVNLFPMRFKDNGDIDFSDIEKYITPKTRMLGLCNPHNPLGKVYPKEDLAYLLELSEKYGFYIMNDEIWSDIVYSDAEFCSICSLGGERNKRTISVFGFSKSFGIAGLRVGAVYCQDEEIFEKLVKASLVDDTIGGVSSLSQVAAISCLTRCYGWLDEFVAHLQSNRDYALERLNRMPGVTCRKPEATFVVFPDISGLSIGAEALVEYLKTEEKLAIVPGGKQFFGPGSEGHVRICLATSREILAEGLDRMERGLRKLDSRYK